MIDDNTKAMIIEALIDEYKARASYRLVLNTFGEIRPFRNIVEAEETHAQALELLCAHFGIPLPKDDWEGKLEPPSSVFEACQASVQGERDNIAMYERFLRQTKVPEVRALFQRLQAASRQHHLPAFERCVARGGQTGSGPMPFGRLRAGWPGRHRRPDNREPRVS
ncbi:ferritin-like domain-containing protein [Nitrospira sp. T9]|uniref:ferritin-like domain-containing protein n=1 Tax=unclassified Nitrospira TaxID=2652172 RepID=UPI003F992450